MPFRVAEVEVMLVAAVVVGVTLELDAPHPYKLFIFFLVALPK